jgi:phosphoenolpyruvate synthase/pyruvate phosphate dikinase
MNNCIKKFEETGIAHKAEVGGKNSSLGEMFSNLLQKGIPVA